MDLEQSSVKKEKCEFCGKYEVMEKSDEDWQKHIGQKYRATAVKYYDKKQAEKKTHNPNNGLASSKH